MDVLNHNRVVVYRVPTDIYEAMLERLEAPRISGDALHGMPDCKLG